MTNSSNRNSKESFSFRTRRKVREFVRNSRCTRSHRYRLPVETSKNGNRCSPIDRSVLPRFFARIRGIKGKAEGGERGRIDGLINKMEQSLFFRRSGPTIHGLATNFDSTSTKTQSCLFLPFITPIFIG